jgi:hypothetical protein
MRRLLIGYAGVVLATLMGTAAVVRADVVLATYFDSSILRYGDDGTPLGAIVPPGGNHGVAFPAGITLGPDGLLYVSNQPSSLGAGSDSIVKVDPATGTVATVVALPDGYAPAGLQFGPDGLLYVSRNGGFQAGQGTGTVDRFDVSTGQMVDSVITNLTQPTNLVFDAHGHLYVSDFGDATIVKYNPVNRRYWTLVQDPNLATPAGLRFGPDRNLYVVDLIVGAVHVYDHRSGAALNDFIPAGGALNNQFPSDVLFLPTQGTWLVANLGPSRTMPMGNVAAFDTLGNQLDDFADNLFAAQLLHLPAR